MPTQQLDSNAQAIPVLKPGTARTVSLTTTSAQSAALGSTVVRLVSDVSTYYALNATADTGSTFLPAGVIEVIRITEGDRVNARAASGTGVLSITELD